MATTQDIGDRLRQAAIDSGLSMKQLAVRSGLFYQSVHGFLRTGRGLSLQSAEKLCKVLGLELRPVRRGKRKA